MYGLAKSAGMIISFLMMVILSGCSAVVPVFSVF